MALAFLQFEGCNANTCQFRADIGTNRLYRYVIGRQKSTQQGLERVDDVTYESPLEEAPTTNTLWPEFSLAISQNQFADRARYIQLISCQDVTKRGEAISDVLTVSIPFQLPNPLPLPDKHLFQNAMQTQCACQQSAAPPATGHSYGASIPSTPQHGVRRVSYAYQTAAVSRAMFWDALLEAARLLVPAVVGAVGSGSTGTAPSGSSILQTITQILNALGTPNAPAATAPAAATSPAPQAAATAPAAPAVATASAWKVRQVRNNGSAYGQRVTYPGKQRNAPRARPAYGKAMIIDGGILTGPLLASLLGPVLQQAPQLLQTVLDSPLKLFNAITARKLGQQQLEQDYLTGLLSSVQQRDLMQRLIASGLLAPPSAPAPALALSVAPSRTVQADFALENPLTVAGKPRFVFLTTQPITLSLRLKSTGGPPVFPKLIVQLRLTDSRTMQTLAEKRYQLKDVPANGTLSLPLAPDELRNVPRNEDVLVGASLIWQNERGNQNVGTYGNQFIYLSDGYVFGKLGAELTLAIALSNMAAHRVFWHKIWEGGGDNRRWQLALTGKYLYVYAPNADTNGRLDTRMQLNEEAVNDPERLTLSGKLKTGLEVSPVMLNELLPSLGAYPSLSQPQLAALRTDDLNPQMNQEATVRLDLKGKRDERGVVWVYPEVVVQELTINRISTTDANGQAMQTQPETAAFPRVQSCHFVGAKTEAQRY